MAKDTAQRKARQRLKRKQKQREQRRAKSVSPYRRIGESGELVSCRFNADWAERGQAVIMVLRQAPGHGPAMAMFMVDLWCAGLKDAGVRLDVAREVFESAASRMDDQIPLSEGDIETARRIVLGSVRFAVRNGFRLPSRYERAGAFLGGLGDWESADLSDFGVEGGKLRWVGPRWDLEKRLIGSRVEDFLAREDVEWIMQEGDEDEPEDEEVLSDDDEATFELFREGLDEFVRTQTQRTSQWCRAKGIEPHRRLSEMLELFAMNSFKQLARMADPHGDADPGWMRAGWEGFKEQLQKEDPQDAIEMCDALDQFVNFIGETGGMEDSGNSPDAENVEQARS